MDVRLKTTPFDLNGKTYQLCCNMNVLADVQEAFGGDISAALRAKNSVRSVLVFLAAMLNDSAETNGWPERFTAKQLGRMFPARCNQDMFATVMDLVVSAGAEEEPDGGADEGKNGFASQTTA